MALNVNTQSIPGLGLVDRSDIAKIAANVGATPNPLSTTISTAGAGTLTAAAIVGGVINRTGPTAGYTDTTDTAAAIIAAVPNAAVNSSWLLFVVNTVAFIQTFSGGTGVTLSGLSGIAGSNSTSLWLVTLTSLSAQTVSMQLLDTDYNNAGGADPSSQLTIFGGGAQTFPEEGNINRQTASVAAPVQPGATGADNVLAVFSIPANSFDQAGRGITVTAAGSFAATANNKTVKLIYNPSTAVVGSTVGTGGTVLATTGVSTGNNVGWWVSGNVFKRGAANSNTQLCTSNGNIVGSTHGGISLPVDATATENAAILVAVTGNAATATTDINFNWMEVNAMN